MRIISSNRHKGKEHLKDKTNIFVDLLKRNAKEEGFGGIAWIQGTTGSGKSAHMCKLFQMFLEFSYDQRNIALYKAPDNLLNAIVDAVPNKYKGKFRIVDRLSEINPFDVVGFDEGYLTANAMGWFKKNAQNFIESLTTLRHNSVFIILNSLDDGILKRFRTKSQFDFYKLMTERSIEENRSDQFLKKYANLISTLWNKDLCLFRTSHLRFARYCKRGILNLPLDEVCSWYNDDISRSFEGECFDAGLRKQEQLKENLEPYILELAGVFGAKITLDDVKGYLYDFRPEIYVAYEDHLPLIKSLIKSRFHATMTGSQKYEQKKNIDINNLKKKDESYKRIQIPEMSRKTKYFDFLCEFYRLNLSHLDTKEREYRARTMQLWAMGLPQSEIYKKVGDINHVNKVIKMYRDGFKIENHLLRQCYALEHYCANYTGGIRFGEIGVPDIIYFNGEKKELFPAEVKSIKPPSPNATKVEFHLFSKASQVNNLNPSYEYCLKHKIKRFPLFYFYPKFSTLPLMYIVEMPDFDKESKISYTFKIDKHLADQYERDFKRFDRNTFSYRSN